MGKGTRKSPGLVKAKAPTGGRTTEASQKGTSPATVVEDDPLAASPEEEATAGPKDAIGAKVGIVADQIPAGKALATVPKATAIRRVDPALTAEAIPETEDLAIAVGTPKKWRKVTTALATTIPKRVSIAGSVTPSTSITSSSVRNSACAARRSAQIAA